MNRRLLNGDAVEPDHIPVVVSQLRVVMIVAFRMVRLEMPMNSGLRVIGVGLVHVLRRNRR